MRRLAVVLALCWGCGHPAASIVSSRHWPAWSPPSTTTTAPVVVHIAGVTPTWHGGWLAVAQCESGEHWDDNTGNGYFGGLQFDETTWLGNGGGAYADRADHATPSQQMAVAERTRSQRGLEPWPVCGARF
jgi:hypothetical protein